MPRPDPPLSRERQAVIDRDLLTPMIAAYSEDEKVRRALRGVIDGSPSLREGLLFAIDAGALRGMAPGGQSPGADASYVARDGLLRFPPDLLERPDKATFVLGHETGHAVDRAINGDHFKDRFIPGMKALFAMADVDPAPRDYTALIRAEIADDRRNEAEAHISGFNALVSRLSVDHARHNDRVENPGERRAVPPTPMDLYLAYPDSMRDFMVVRGKKPDLAVSMKPGLNLEDDGTLSLDAGTERGRGNIDAMKVYHADRLPCSLGPNEALNYPHKILIEGLETALMAERTAVRGNERTHFVVDFEGLGFKINPALMRTPPGNDIPVAPSLDLALPGLLVDRELAQTLSGSQGILARRLLEQATTALEEVDPDKLEVPPDSPAFGTVCAYTAALAARHDMTAIGCVIPSDNGGLILCNKADPRDEAAKLIRFDHTVGLDAPVTEHLERLHASAAKQVTDHHEQVPREQAQAATRKSSGGCVVM